MKIPAGVKVGDCLEVVWNDANHPSDVGWKCRAEWIEDDPDLRIRSVGYFVDVKSDYLRIASDESVTEDMQSIVGRVFHIPLGWIREVSVMGKCKGGKGSKGKGKGK